MRCYFYLVEYQVDFFHANNANPLNKFQLCIAFHMIGMHKDSPSAVANTLAPCHRIRPAILSSNQVKMRSSSFILIQFSPPWSRISFLHQPLRFVFVAVHLYAHSNRHSPFSIRCTCHVSAPSVHVTGLSVEATSFFFLSIAHTHISVLLASHFTSQERFN